MASILMAPRSLADRLWAKVDRSGGDHKDVCWPWTGYVGQNKGTGRGYGQIRVGSTTDGTRRLVKAHRLSLVLASGEDPPDKDACHTCDNSVCCRPLHLFWGTHRQNMADYIVKYGRVAVSKRPLPPRPGLPFEEPTDAELMAAALDAAMEVFDEP